MPPIYKLLILPALFLLSLPLKAQTTGVVTINTNPRVNEIIAKKKEYNKNKKIKGFKIQVFNGTEHGAYQIRDKFEALFPDVDVKIQFASPEWKVHVGNYFTRLDADRELLKIKEEFSNAVVLPAVIEID